MAYIELEELKDFLDITDSDDDDVLEQIIASAESASDHYTGRIFEPKGRHAGHQPHRFTPLPRERFGDVDDTNPRLLWLGSCDLSEIQSIVNGDGTVVPSGQYVKLPRNHSPWFAIELKSGSGKIWTYSGNSPEDSIVITGKWCYSLEAPEDVRMAMFKLCKAWYNGRADSNGERDILSTDGVVLVQSKIPSDVTAMLKHYRRYS